MSEISGSQTDATLGTASIDDFAAVTGGHTGTEAVGAGTLQVAGLKSSFHVCLPVEFEFT